MDVLLYSIEVADGRRLFCPLLINEKGALSTKRRRLGLLSPLLFSCLRLHNFHPMHECGDDQNFSKERRSLVKFSPGERRAERRVVDGGN